MDYGEQEDVQQVRADYAGSDIERGWGTRRSAPRDYIFDRPVLIGRMRIGPDLANVGKRAPVEEAEPAAAAAPPPAAATDAAPAAAQPPAGEAPVAAAPPATPTPEPPVVPALPLEPGGEPPAYSAAWHHQHLYDPRSVNRYSIMPSFRFLYEKRKISGQRADDALQFSGADAPEAGWEVVPRYEAQALVAYLMSLDQSHELKEVKSAPAAPPPAPGTAAK
jgi:cytochrome c oxidase cbb3-type subunit 2